MKHALYLVALLLCGCSTIVEPWTFPVPVDSVPPGAVVVGPGGTEVGRTPCVVTLPRGDTPMLRLLADGYHPQDVQVANRPFDLPPALIDILLFPLAIVDIATGAWRPIDTSPLQVQLIPLALPAPRIWKRADYVTTAAATTAPGCGAAHLGP